MYEASSRASRDYRDANFLTGRDLPPGYALLTGRPGMAGVVAGAINRVTAQPNSEARLPLGVFDATLRRGSGNDITAAAPGGIRASGYLDPGQTQGVGISGITARLPLGMSAESIPKQARIFNTPSGELRFEIYPGLDVDIPFTDRDVHIGAGQHVIGQRDPRRSSRR